MRRVAILAAITLAVAVGCSPAVKYNTSRVNGCAEPANMVEVTSEQKAEWQRAGEALNAAWGDIDYGYERHAVPQEVSKQPHRLTAWRGERVSAQMLLWSNEAEDDVRCTVGEFNSPSGTLAAEIARPYFVRYTIANGNSYSEDWRVAGETILAPDMLDTLSMFQMAAQETRPVWITIDVPQEATADTYLTSVSISQSGKVVATLPLELEVVDHTLPKPAEWSFHLDLWQHPSAVARAYGVELWSDEHFEAMRPLMRRLAEAGQKVITCTLNKDPWNSQCYDDYEAMIVWTKQTDGVWSYDYTIFDRWVAMMLDLGIDKAINCYSMVPWNCELEYYDEQTETVVKVKAEPGTAEFTQMWEPFLRDFRQHLQHKGWLEMTNIAMDERSPEAMQAAAELLTRVAPEMGFALADNHRSYKQFTMMRDVCVAMNHQIVDKEDIEMRRSKGHTTTFYVCCSPLFPNTFSSSQPYEAEMLGWINIAYDYDGILRWAYNSWNVNPHYDSRYGSWMSGDTYLVYPFNRSTMRFERLRDGVEGAEKIRLLRQKGCDMSGVDAVLEKIRTTDILDPTQPWKEILDEARKALAEVAQ